MEPIITITAKLLDKNSGKPLPNDGTFVKLYDKDLLDDDFLGQSKVNDEGSVSITFKPSDFSSSDSPGEKYPDLYFTVYKYGKLIFKSTILKDLKIDRLATLDAIKGRVIDLGTFVIE